MRRSNERVTTVALALLLAAGVSGCGLAETGTAAAVDAKANADAAEAGLKAEAKIRADLEAAQQAAAARRQAGDE